MEKCINGMVQTVLNKKISIKNGYRINTSIQGPCPIRPGVTPGGHELWQQKEDGEEICKTNTSESGQRGIVAKLRIKHREMCKIKINRRRHRKNRTPKQAVAGRASVNATLSQEQFNHQNKDQIKTIYDEIQQEKKANTKK